MKTVTTPQNKETVEETVQNMSMLVMKTIFREALNEMKSDERIHCKKFGWNFEPDRHYPEGSNSVIEPRLVSTIDDVYEVWVSRSLVSLDWEIRRIN